MFEEGGYEPMAAEGMVAPSNNAISQGLADSTSLKVFVGEGPILGLLVPSQAHL